MGNYPCRPTFSKGACQPALSKALSPDVDTGFAPTNTIDNGDFAVSFFAAAWPEVRAALAGLADHMSAPSVHGRGAIRAPRHTAKIIRMPTPEGVRRDQRKRLLGLLALATVLAVVAAHEYFANSEAAGATLRTRLRPNAAETRLMRLVNAARESAGESALTFSMPMMAAAYFHSADMAHEGYVGYDGPAGDTPVDRLTMRGIAYHEIAETLYRAKADRISDLADRALVQWLANPLDRGHLLTPQFRKAAIAISRAADGSFCITQDLAR
jgi:uncharacterized protein YkwD